MKPEDFKLNSDYLCLATDTHFETTASFGGGTIPGNNSEQQQTLELPAPFADKAISKFMISLDGNEWFPGGDYSFDFSSNVGARFMVQRIGTQTIRAYLFIGNGGSSAESYPAKTFHIKEYTISAPDMV